MTGSSDALAFSLADVRASLQPDVVERGAAYARAGYVGGINVSSGGAVITSRVRGTAAAPYEVSVYALRTRASRTIVRGVCSCPVGSDCKHVAATLIAALQRPGASLPASAANTTFARATRHQEDAAPRDPIVDHWLESIHETLPPPADAATVGTERVAYVFAPASASIGRRFPVAVLVVRRTKAERWAKIRDTTPESLAGATARAVLPEDAMIGRLMQMYERTDRARFALAEEIVQRIIATERAHFEHPDSPPLSLGATCRARLAWTLGGDGAQRPSLTFEEPGIVPLPGPVPWYVDPQTGIAGPIDADLPNATLSALLAAPALSPTQANRVRETFADPIAGLRVPMPLEITERVVRVQPVPVLRLRTIENPTTPVYRWGYGTPAPQTSDVADFSFGYGDASVDPASRADEIRCVSKGESLVYVRSHAAEKRFAQRLQVFDFLRDPDARRAVGGSGLFLRFDEDDAARWPIFVHQSVAALRAEGWRIEIDPNFRHRVVDLADDAAWQTNIAETADGWFDLAIGLDVEGRRVDLLALLTELLQTSPEFGDPAYLENLGQGGAYYVTLAGTSITLAFPTDRLKAILATLVELSDPDALRADGILRLPRVRAALVSELEAASGLRWDVPEKLRLLGERLRTFTGVARVPVPASFRGELRPYQRDGLDWLQFLARYGFGGILADDMGLGKSVQTLAHLLCEKEAGRLTQPALLVVPTSLVHNWCDEAARFAPDLRILPLHGPARAERFAQIAKYDVVITTYALLVRDSILRERTWHAVILDEAQALKNPQAKVAQVAMGLRAAHRLCLTGTPVENHLGDLWSIFSIALPGALGDRKGFGRVFRIPIEKRGDSHRNRALAARIAPFLLRRTKDAVATELPEKTEIIQRVELAGAQRDLYETVRIAMHRRVRDEIAARGLARSQIIILDALLKLRQVCCDPRLLPQTMHKPAPSVKLDLLLEMLPQMIDEGRRILIFSQFTSMLDLIGSALAAQSIPFVILTGQTKDRATVVKRFQAGDVPVFLISLKAGGTGLNLTAADTVIHYDPWWNPAVERQATDRAHRIGQTQHIFVYKFIGSGTVEEKIVNLQQRKAQLAAAIFAENGGTSARFAAEDVERLFAPLDAS